MFHHAECHTYQPTEGIKKMTRSQQLWMARVVGQQRRQWGLQGLPRPLVSVPVCSLCMLHMAILPAWPQLPPPSEAGHKGLLGQILKEKMGPSIRENVPG